MWGINGGGGVLHWFAIHSLTGIFFMVLLPLSGILTIFGFWKEDQTGKKLMNANFILLLVIMLYSIIGIQIYSEEIIGVQFGYFDIFLYLDYGFYLLLLNVIIAAISFWKHPLED
jgi:hypothetical protein